jgi:hypothetical protein
MINSMILEGSGSDQDEVLCLNLPRRAEKYQDKPVEIADVSSKIRIQHNHNTSQ